MHGPVFAAAKRAAAATLPFSQCYGDLKAAHIRFCCAVLRLPDMDNPTKPETVQQNSGQADVSQGFNSNLSSADVAETEAAAEIEAAHQRGGQESSVEGVGISQVSDADQQLDESGMLSPQGQDRHQDQQPGEAQDAARLGQSGEDRNRTS